MGIEHKLKILCTQSKNDMEIEYGLFYADELSNAWKVESIEFQVINGNPSTYYCFIRYLK